MRGARPLTVPSHRHRTFAWAAVLVRLMIVFVVAELSGAFTVVESAYREAGAAGCCTDCPMEKNGNECPPGCPSCHCAHGAVSLPRASESSLVSTVAPSGGPSSAPYAASIPRPPPPSGVYRPPRSIVSPA